MTDHEAWQDALLKKIQSIDPKEIYAITYYDGDQEDLGYLITTSSKCDVFIEKLRKDAFDRIGISKDTLVYVQSLPESQRKRLEKEAKIYHHKQEIERLTKELLESLSEN